MNKKQGTRKKKRGTRKKKEEARLKNVHSDGLLLWEVRYNNMPA